MKMENVRFSDPVYGDVAFNEPLLVDVYHAPAVQRLAHIYQGGITAFLRPARNTTRLEHSLGVMTLLRSLGADVYEQAAGLVHDIAHTAFSHVVDFVFPNQEHTYHDDQAEDVWRVADLPEILARHNIDWQWLAEAENFTLLERPLPALCADRLDYFLRDGLSLSVFPLAEVADFLAHLRVWDGVIVVDDVDAARWLGERFIEMDEILWCSTQEVGWYAVMARALRAALENAVIEEADFRGTDEVIMARLRACQVPAVHYWLDMLTPTLDFVRDDVAPDFEALPKVRAVDPPVLLNGHVTTLSSLDAAFARHRETYVASKQGTWGLKIMTTN